MKKFSIIKVDQDYAVQIIQTHLFHKDAIEYLTALIDKTYKNDDEIKNYKVYYDRKDEITVNWIGYFSKGLMAKYYIIEYEDTTGTTLPITKSN